MFASEGAVEDAAASDGWVRRFPLPSQRLTSYRRSIHAYFPPAFLHNLAGSSSSATATLTLSLSRLPSPAFPVAHSLTVARVASPHSVHRAYQSLFLDGLKEYFKNSKRVLKKGDLIAVGICEEAARYTEGKTEDADVEYDLPLLSLEPS